MKKLLLIILLFISVFSFGQLTSQLPISTFTASSQTPVSGNITGSGTQFVQITWNVTGTLSACVVRVDSSADGISWNTGDIIAAQTCTSGGAALSSNKVVNFVRINTNSSISGTGSLIVNLTGYAAAPSGTVASLSLPIAQGSFVQQTGNTYPGPGLYFCGQTTTCTTFGQLFKIDTTLASGMPSISSSFYSVGSGNWKNQSFLGANALNNTLNINTHKEQSTPTVSNIQTDTGGPHMQPVESAVIFPNLSGPSDFIRTEFEIICQPCASNAGTTIQVRIADPVNSCTATIPATITIGGSNQIMFATADVEVNANVNGTVSNLDFELLNAGGGSTFGGRNKTSTCQVNLGGNYAIGMDILMATTATTNVQTWAGYLVKSYGVF